ncbi:MAG: DUF4351 domain-containing protein [Cyanobacteriota bacterium]
MRESVTYQALVEESERRGLTQGIQQGEVEIILRLLRRKIGELPTSLETKICSLTTPQLETLGESLLEFKSLTDLRNWLQRLD